MPTMPYAHLAAQSHALMANSPGRLVQPALLHQPNQHYKGGFPSQWIKKDLKKKKKSGQLMLASHGELPDKHFDMMSYSSTEYQC